MSLIRACVISIAMYSKIPMPHFEWNEKDMRYAMCFFPLVGAVIGGLTCLWFYIGIRFEVGTLCLTLIGTAIPLMVTGGIHMDGYMDTMDALHSYQPREKKLEILKDPHIGAFAVLMLVLYYLIYIGSYSQIDTLRIAGMLGMGFVLSRILSAVGLVTIPSAKKEGMLFTFASRAEKRGVRIALIAEGIAAAVLMLWMSVGMGVILVAGSVLIFLWYRAKSIKEFGGITGDTAGWFLALCELWFAVGTGICGRILL